MRDKKGRFIKGHPALALKMENHPFWKADKVGYTALHKWVIKMLGKPNLCNHCESKKAKQYDWANISGKYLRVLDDWIRLCR